MTRRAPRRLAGGLLALLLLAGSCTTGTAPPPPVDRGTTEPGEPSEAVRSSREALALLCRRPEPPEVDPGEPGPLPPAVAEVVRQVEEVRELSFPELVLADPVSHEELVERLDRYLDYSYPEEMLDRRTRAWRAIGVIPPDADLQEALLAYTSTQIIGFYDPASGELVFIGTDDPSPLEHITLAHELTHAIDDQHFELDRLNDLEAACREEELLAGVGAVEGSAQLFSSMVAQRFLTQEELSEVAGAGGGGVPPAVPPFVQELQFWPYLAGLRFMSALLARGGVEAVNGALEDLPVSTEQVIHPERYPDDRPREVGVPDLGPALGNRWEDLDVYTVGEEFLSAMLRLRLGSTEGREAAAGWDGGLYRAFSDGGSVAVVMVTLWDDPREAEEFARALESWIDEASGTATAVLLEGERVTALWAPGDEVLAALEEGLSADT